MVSQVTLCVAINVASSSVEVVSAWLRQQSRRSLVLRVIYGAVFMFERVAETR